MTKKQAPKKRTLASRVESKEYAASTGAATKRTTTYKGAAKKPVPLLGKTLKQDDYINALGSMTKL